MAKKSLEERIESTKSYLKDELNTVRAGRANPALLDRIQVNYYGTPTPLKALATRAVKVRGTFLPKFTACTLM